MATILRAFALLVIWVPVWAAGLSGLTDRESSGALKQALVQGAGRAVDLLGQPGGFLDNRKVRTPPPDGLAQIESYVTRKALDGLFRMIAEEERAIRRNPLSAAGSLAQRVFGALGR